MTRSSCNFVGAVNFAGRGKNGTEFFTLSVTQESSVLHFTTDNCVAKLHFRKQSITNVNDGNGQISMFYKSSSTIQISPILLQVNNNKLIILIISITYVICNANNGKYTHTHYAKFR